MQAQGTEEEEAALALGASGWQTFWRVTLPNVKWGLLYGVILCNARAMGEFGAVSVVSGHIRGQTNTMPLHVEILYNEYNFAAAFAVASLLALLALVTLVAQDRSSSGSTRPQRTPAQPRGSGQHEHRGRATSARRSATSRRSTTSSLAVPTRRAASRCSGRRARARRRCCASSPASSSPIAARSSSTARTSPTRRVRERSVGFVFQHYALFRHMTVFENIAFGLRVRPQRERPPEREIRRRVRELLELVQLDGLAGRLSHPALGRPAAARGARARARRRAAGAAARRAVRRARREGAQGAAPLAAPAARRDARHERLRHARPGGGARGRRPRRRDEPGPHRAGRHAGRGLRPSRHAVRAASSSAT